MKKFLIVAGVFVGIVAMLSLGVYGWVTGTYNSFVSQTEVIDTAWSDVETQYQRRYDLIPNLVNSTKGYLAQEQAVFGAIAEARIHYGGTASGSEERVAATNQLEGALSRLLVIMENYPVLQSNQTVQGLMDELSGTENRVTVARQRYNETVRTYNIGVKTFPRNLLAGYFKFEERTLFEASEGTDKAPTVDLTIK